MHLVTQFQPWSIFSSYFQALKTKPDTRRENECEFLGWPEKYPKSKSVLNEIKPRAECAFGDIISPLKYFLFSALRKLTRLKAGKLV